MGRPTVGPNRGATGGPRPSAGGRRPTRRHRVPGNRSAGWPGRATRSPAPGAIRPPAGRHQRRPRSGRVLPPRPPVLLRRRAARPSPQSASGARERRRSSPTAATGERGSCRGRLPGLRLPLWPFPFPPPHPGAPQARGAAEPSRGSRKARLRWTGPGRPVAPRASSTDLEARDRHDHEAAEISRPGVDLPADGAAEQPHLVNGLGRPETVQLRRTIGGDSQQGHSGMMSLYNGGVQLGGGRTTGGYDDGGHPGGQPQAKSEKAGRALVAPTRASEPRPAPSPQPRPPVAAWTVSQGKRRRRSPRPATIRQPVRRRRRLAHLRAPAGSSLRQNLPVAPDRRPTNNPAPEARPLQEGHDQAQYPAGEPETPETLARPAPGEAVPAERRRLSVRSIPQPVPTGAEPLVLLHGFTQTGASWGARRGRSRGTLPHLPPRRPRPRTLGGRSG